MPTTLEDGQSGLDALQRWSVAEGQIDANPFHTLGNTADPWLVCNEVESFARHNAYHDEVHYLGRPSRRSTPLRRSSSLSAW